VAPMGDTKSSYGLILKPGRRKNPVDDVGLSGMIILNENRRVHNFFFTLGGILSFSRTLLYVIS